MSDPVASNDPSKDPFEPPGQQFGPPPCIVGGPDGDFNISVPTGEFIFMSWDCRGNAAFEGQCHFTNHGMVPPGMVFNVGGTLSGSPSQPGVWSGQVSCDECDAGCDVLSWQVTADPHFVSLRGEKFDFHGEPNKYFNLYSDRNVQANALFVDWQLEWQPDFTAMSELGIKWKAMRIKIDAVSKLLFVNDVQVYDMWFDGGFIRTVDKLRGKYADVPDRVEDFGDFSVGYLIRLQNYEFLVTISTDNLHPSRPTFLNFFASFYNMPAPPDAHGVVGQTGRYKGGLRVSEGSQGEGIVEGHYLDYEVSNLWADNFKHNRWVLKRSVPGLL
jgi:hypothetical protein